MAFDRELRSRWWGVPEWRRIQPAQLLRLKVADSEAGAVFGLLSLSPNGHLREAAVRELEKVKDGAEVPFLLIRLNDWVQPVRDASRRAVLDRFRAVRFSAFFDQLESVFRLEQCHREDHAVIVAAVMQSIVAKDADEHLCAALKSGSRFVRRRTYSHAMIAEGANTPRIVRLALASEDGVLRIWATGDATKVATDAGACASHRLGYWLMTSIRCAVRRSTVSSSDLQRTHSNLWLMQLSDRNRSFASLHGFICESVPSLILPATIDTT